MTSIVRFKGSLVVKNQSKKAIEGALKKLEEIGAFKVSIIGTVGLKDARNTWKP